MIEKWENMFVAVDRLWISVILWGRVKFWTAYNVTATLGTDYTDISLYITNHSKRGTYTSMRNSISKGKIEDTHLGSVIKWDMHHWEQSIEITPYYRQRYWNMVNEALLACRNLGR